MSVLQDLGRACDECDLPDIANDPGYRFQLQQGMKAIEAAALSSTAPFSIPTAPANPQDAAHGIYFRDSRYASRYATARTLKGNQ